MRTINLLYSLSINPSRFYYIMIFLYFTLIFFVCAFLALSLFFSHDH